MVHLSTLETALEAVAFGADGLVHAWRDEVVSEEGAQRFAAADIFVVPTLSVMVSADDPAVAELVGETDLLARAGMGSAEGPAAATSVAADAFGVAERDLEDDGSSSHDIVAIWRDGYLVARAAASGAGPQAEIARAPAKTLVVDFGDGFDASFGAWDVTVDQLNGGSSTAAVAVRNGALVVTGEIAAGVPFPWAGVIWIPGAQPMQPIDFSGRKAIRFRTRADGRQYSVMLIGSAEPAGPSPTVTFTAPEEWTQVEIRLEDFPTPTPEVIAGLAFVAEGPVGGFEFEVDEVEVR